MKGTRSYLLCFVIIGLMMLAPNQASAATHPLDGTGGQIAPSSGYRTVSIPVKVVFVGIDPATVDLSYSKWNVNVPSTIYGQVLAPQPYLTGVVYKLDYNYTFASNCVQSQTHLVSAEHRSQKACDKPLVLLLHPRPVRLHISRISIDELRCLRRQLSRGLDIQ